jgi:hypothetical protein
MTEIIAERKLYGEVDGTETEITVTIWKPELIAGKHHPCWRCQVTYSNAGGVPELEDYSGPAGYDSVQALHNALTLIGKALDNSGIEWSMFPSSEDEYGGELREDGFPRPEFDIQFLGTAFRKRMQFVVEAEKLAALARRRKPKQPVTLLDE